jgi:hypothetical protein
MSKKRHQSFSVKVQQVKPKAQTEFTYSSPTEKSLILYYAYLPEEK